MKLCQSVKWEKLALVFYCDITFKSASLSKSIADPGVNILVKYQHDAYTFFLNTRGRGTIHRHWTKRGLYPLI